MRRDADTMSNEEARLQQIKKMAARAMRYEIRGFVCVCSISVLSVWSELLLLLLLLVVSLSTSLLHFVSLLSSLCPADFICVLVCDSSRTAGV